MVRELIVRILRRDGYVVHAAASGSEALGLLDQLDRPVDVLLTDMVMPGMGGRELAEQVLERAPTTPVVFMSGYTEDAPTIGGASHQTLDVSDEALLVGVPPERGRAAPGQERGPRRSAA